MADTSTKQVKILLICNFNRCDRNFCCYFRTIPVWLSWLPYLSWFNYGFEALIVNQWDGYGNISK